MGSGAPLAHLDALERELAPFFGGAELERILRRAARRLGGQQPGALAELPLVADADGYRLLLEHPTPGQIAWCAGFLEGADPAGRAVALQERGGVRLRYAAPRGPEEPEDFQLPDAGPLRPYQIAQVTDLSDDAIFFVDRDKRIRAWNKGAEQLFGYRAEEAIGQYFDLLVPQDLRERGELDTIMRETVRSGTLRLYLTRRRTRDGRERLVSLTRTLVRDRRGALAGYGIVMRDVTAAEELQRELEGARRLAQVGELATQVAHEVRNPLAGIHGALQVLRRRLQPGPQEDQVFEDVAGEIARLDHIVTDLLRFGRPAPPQKRVLDLAEWLEDWQRRMHGEAELRRALLALEVRTRPRVAADPLFLEQVLRNLFENAVEAQAGRVRLVLEQDGGAARIWFRDDGGGIPEELRARVLQPFFTTKGRGSGLGLPICASLLRSLDGALTVHPDEGGAVLSVSLPLA